MSTPGFHSLIDGLSSEELNDLLDEIANAVDDEEFIYDDDDEIVCSESCGNKKCNSNDCGEKKECCKDKCTCGTEAAGGGIHSSWCNKK